MADQQIGFCTTSDGVRIAYAKLGSGPPLVYATGWPVHLEVEWQKPFVRRFLEDLAQGLTLIRYDMRGSGLSDENVTDFSLGALMRDLEGVVDHLGLDRFALLSLGFMAGPLALTYAANHPERVTRLILNSGWLRGADLAPPERQRALVDYVANFGYPASELFDSSDVQNQADMRQIIKASASPRVQAEVLKETYSADLSEVVSQISVPALVLHARGDPLVPFQLGHELAVRLANADFVPYEGSSPNLWMISDILVREIQRFVGPTSSIDAERKALPEAGESYTGNVTEREVEVPDIRFCTTTDGVRIAFTAVGQGPPLVCLGAWFYMLEPFWHEPRAQRFFRSLGEGRRLITLDRRGVGASQREVQDVGLESGVADLAAVVDHLHLSTFSLLGWFDGAAVSALYSTRYPERVYRLILLGPYVRGADVYRRVGVDGLIQLMRGSWPAACATMASRTFPDGPPELIPWLAKSYSEGFSAEIAERYLVYASTLDASPFLTRVTAPTLVMHRQGSRVPPADALSRDFAAMIPNARLLAVEGQGTVLWLETTTIFDAVNAFLTEGVSPAGLTRREAEVLGLLAVGKSNLEISAQLFLSLRTVERHITNVYGKLGVRNRAEATAYAVKLGLA